MATELTKAQATALQRSRSIISMSSTERRRFAVQAANERDFDDLWSLLEAFLARKQASAHTLSAYRKGLRVLLEAWQGVNLLRPSREEAELFVLDLSAPDREIDAEDRNKYRDGQSIRYKPLAPATVRARVSAAKAFYEALAWAGATDANPFEGVLLPKLRSRPVDRAREKAYTQEELERMARVCQDWDDRLILLLGAHAGLRASEMLALRWEDVDLRAGRLTVRFGKGGTTASVTMSDELARNLRTLGYELFPTGSASGEVLSTRSRSRLYERVKRLWIDGFVLEGAEVPPFTKGVHGLRHHAGVTYARQTYDLRKVRDHLRHASMSSTEIYMAAAESTDEVRDWEIGFDED